MLRSIAVATFTILLSVSSIGLTSASAADLKVVASFSIIADYARNVGGNRIELKTLVGPNADAHVYEPKPSDARALAEADVVLVNGLQFEGFLNRVVEASGTKAPIVELTKGIEPLKNAEEDGHEAEEHADAHDGHNHGEFDPHVWQSAANARIYVKNIADAFCTADPDGCDSYKANAATYDKKLEALHSEIKAAVAALPADKRTVITSHDAFGYFAHAYGLKFLAPEGVSTESEASAADVAKLIQQIRIDKAAALFVENITNPRLVEQISSETGLKVGGELYSDALSSPEGPASTYVDMMKHNIATIRSAIEAS